MELFNKVDKKRGIWSDVRLRELITYDSLSYRCLLLV